MWASHTISNNTSPNINAELLVVSSLKYAMRIVLCPLVVVVNIHGAVSANVCLVSEEH
jgi:hypothetical protein